MFHISNCCKCYPSSSRTPQKEHIQAWSKHLNYEIQQLKPILILAFGNTGLKFFKEQEEGITKMNGVIEWSEIYKCWIIYCIHPAAVLRNSTQYKDGFINTIRKFYDTIKLIGGNYLSRTRERLVLKECPYGGKFAKDNNLYEQCEDCEIWNDCAKAISLLEWR
jgi:hypothetical protein